MIGTMGEACVTRPEIGRHSRHASTPSACRNPWSATPREDLLSSTPRLSYCSNSNAEQLVQEIAATELEIIHLERQILSLYRTTFSHYLTKSHTSAQFCSFDANFHAEDFLKDDQFQKACQEKMLKNGDVASEDRLDSHETNKMVSRGDIDEGVASEPQFSGSSPLHNLTRSVSKLPSREISENHLVRTVSGHHTLADHLCASVRENLFGTPCKLSEDILKCIAAVYCKLNKKTAQADLSSSPISSLSSSSTLSPQDQSENWSPHYYYEPTTSPSQLEMLKEKSCPYSGMVQITKICVDKDRFKCAAALLEGHRLLVRRLESIDPSKLDQEEKLAFWINIHNAMVMHAFIAYGLENNHIKSMPSMMKKSYNVGGVHFNAYEIQTSIFGCRPHRPEANTRSLLPQVRKFKTMNGKHAYALDSPEPLVHFALCLGVYSDPAVRVYTSKNVGAQLKLAKEEFIQNNSIVFKESKITLPKILEHYMKDASLNLSAVLEIVHDCLSESERQALRRCIKTKRSKCIQWSSYNPTFRYMLHRDLDSDKR